MIIQTFREQYTSVSASLRNFLSSTAISSLPLVFSTSYSSSGNPHFQSSSCSITLNFFINLSCSPAEGRCRAVRNSRLMIAAFSPRCTHAHTHLAVRITTGDTVRVQKTQWRGRPNRDMQGRFRNRAIRESKLRSTMLFYLPQPESRPVFIQLTPKRNFRP